MSENLIIKNMVCARCIESVEDTLNRLAIPYRNIRLGEVELNTSLSRSDQKQLASELEKQGFELLEDRESRLINQVKSEVVRFIQHRHEWSSHNLSSHLSVHLNKEYSTLSKLFSQVEGRTLENYFLHQRIEKVKELLTYDELSLSEIADLLNFSSVAHLSGQFKKITGMTPSIFKKLGAEGRKSLDQI